MSLIGIWHWCIILSIGPFLGFWAVHHPYDDYLLPGVGFWGSMGIYGGLFVTLVCWATGRLEVKTSTSAVLRLLVGSVISVLVGWVAGHLLLRWPGP